VKNAGFIRQLMCSTCLLLLFAAPAAADNWPFWRGPNNNGISPDARLPIEWSETKNIAWKLEMPGKAGSTPVIWNDKIFLTSAEGNDLALLCVRTDGTLAWKRKVAPAVRLVIKYDEANEASASPSTDGKHVFVFVGSGHCAAFDFEGNEVWKFDVQERYGKFEIQHGVHTTPLLHEDRLFLSLLHSGAHWLVAIDKGTGKELWKIERKSDAKGESREAYASPTLWRTGKEACVVVLGCDYATGHRVEDGAEIWRLGDLNPKANYSTALRIISSPVANPELLVVPTARGGIAVGLKPGAKGMIQAGGDFEQWRIAKGSPDVPSPLVYNGLVYLPRENGVLICMDASSAKIHYQERLHADRYRASPVLADGKLYWNSRDGTFSVVKAGPKFDLLATNKLPDLFTASPAVADNRLYLRGFGALWAIQEQKQK